MSTTPIKLAQYIPEAWDVLSQTPLIQCEVVVSHLEMADGRLPLEDIVKDRLMRQIVTHRKQDFYDSVRRDDAPDAVHFRAVAYVLTRDEAELMVAKAYLAGQDNGRRSKVGLP